MPKAGIGNHQYVAVFDPYSDVNMNRAAAKDLYNKIVESNLQDVDVVISAEAKGAALAQRVADYLNTDLLVFRKKVKINFEKPVIAHVKTFTSGIILIPLLTHSNSRAFLTLTAWLDFG